LPRRKNACCACHELGRCASTIMLCLPVKNFDPITHATSTHVTTCHRKQQKHAICKEINVEHVILIAFGKKRNHKTPQPRSRGHNAPNHMESETTPATLLSATRRMASSKFQATRIENTHFVHDFSQFSRSKLLRRAFRARLPPFHALKLKIDHVLVLQV